MLRREVDDVLVLNVDNLTDLDLRAFFEHHRQSGVAMSIASHYYRLQLPFGELVTEEGYLKAYVEKPSTSHLISSGIYVLGRRAIDQIPRETRMQVPELTEILCRRSLRILCYPHQAWWIDINDEQALATANEKLGLAIQAGAGSP
jgi:NDP-mannose synthase